MASNVVHSTDDHVAMTLSPIKRLLLCQYSILSITQDKLLFRAEGFTYRPIPEISWELRDRNRLGYVRIIGSKCNTWAPNAILGMMLAQTLSGIDKR